MVRLKLLRNTLLAALVSMLALVGPLGQQQASAKATDVTTLSVALCVTLLAAGASAVLSKPLHLEDLFWQVDRLL